MVFWRYSFEREKILVFPAIIELKAFVPIHPL